MKIIWKFIGLILLFPQKGYWFLWRKYQLSNFKYCGNKVYIGKNCIFTYKNISIGNDVFIGSNACIQSAHGEVIIGNHVMFGPNVQIHGGNHKYAQVGKYMKDIDDKMPGEDGIVKICNDVWVGAGAIILKSVTIGEGSIIGAGSVITRDVEPYTIVVGALPRKKFKRFEEATLAVHQAILAERHE